MIGTGLDRSGREWWGQRRGGTWRAIARALLVSRVSWLCVLTPMILFAQLGTRGLNEPDEGRYAEVGREMAAGGSWLVPHLNGFEHLSKPPLTYWAIAASIRLFGATEWAVRLPSALAALGTLWLTFLIARDLFGRTVAASAVLVLMASIEFLVLGRTASTDMLLTLWTTAAIACLVRHAAVGRGRWQWGFFAAMGLGFLTKGPMALVVPLAAAVPLQFAARRAGRPWRLAWLPGLALALAVGLGWFVALAARHPQLVGYFAGHELVARFATGVHGRVEPFWFFIPVLGAGMLPWTPFLIPAALGLPGGESPRRSPAGAMLGGWIAIPLLILSLSGSKLLTYVLPILPALALAVACWWEKAARPRAPWLFPVSVLACAVGLAGVTLVVLRQTGHPEFDLDEWVMVLLPPLVGAVCLLQRFAAGGALATVALGYAALWVTYSMEADELAPVLGPHASVRPLARYLKAQPDYGSARVFAAGVRAHGLEFYLGRTVTVTRQDVDLVLAPDPAQRARLLDSPAGCARVFAGGGPAYGVVAAADFAREFAPLGWRWLLRAGDFLLIANPSAGGRIADTPRS